MVAGPSAADVVFQFMPNGAVVSVPEERAADVELDRAAIGEVASEADAADQTVPLRTWPSVGEPTVATSGSVLSTTLSASAVVVTLPALSVMMMRRS